MKLEKLTKQLRQSREENDFYETHLRDWTQELTQLAKELDKPSNMNLHQDQTALINKISVDITLGKSIGRTSSAERYFVCEDNSHFNTSS